MFFISLAVWVIEEDKRKREEWRAKLNDFWGVLHLTHFQVSVLTASVAMAAPAEEKRTHIHTHTQSCFCLTSIWTCLRSEGDSFEHSRKLWEVEKIRDGWKKRKNKRTVWWVKWEVACRWNRRITDVEGWDKHEINWNKTAYAKMGITPCYAVVFLSALVVSRLSLHFCHFAFQS